MYVDISFTPKGGDENALIFVSISVSVIQHCVYSRCSSLFEKGSSSFGSLNSWESSLSVELLSGFQDRFDGKCFETS